MLTRPAQLNALGPSPKERPRAWTSASLARIEDWVVAETIDDGEPALVGHIFHHPRMGAAIEPADTLLLVATGAPRSAGATE